MRPRNILIVVAAIAIVALLVLSFLDQLIVDYLWYGRLGFGGVFSTTVGAEIAIFLVVWLVAFSAIFVSGLIAIGGSRHHQRLPRGARPRAEGEGQPPHMIRALREPAASRVVVAGGAALRAP